MTSTRCTGREKLIPTPPTQSATIRKGTHVFNNNGSFLLALFEFFIFFAWFMCLFWIFGDLFRSKDIGGGAKTLWTLFLIFLPILGMLIYLIARGGGMTERAQAAQAEAQKRQDAYIRSVATSNGGKGSAADEIASAKALLDSGAINATEFEQLKAKALGTGTASPVR
jgi:Phospholipase_D-nuclease N-terminal